MNFSENMDKIGTALSKAQAEMGGAVKDSNNPFFKSKYADLTSVWKACKDALHNNGLAVIQSPIEKEGRIGVSTMLLHSSGQWVHGDYTLGVKKENDPQADGSSITYARRYALAAFVGVCPEDDDANKATFGQKKQNKKADNPQKTYDELQAGIDRTKSAEDVDIFCTKNKQKIYSMNDELIGKFRGYATDLKKIFKAEQEGK